MNTNKISSMSLFTNEYTNNKAVFAIHFEGSKNNGFNVKLKEVSSISGANIKGTHPIGQNPIASVLSRRSASIKSLLKSDATIVACYTGRHDVAGMSISVDVIRTTEQAVSFITFGNIENPSQSRKISVAFAQVNCVRSGSQFKAAVWGDKASAAGVTVKNMAATVDHAPTIEGVEIVERLIASGNVEALVVLGRAVAEGLKRLEDKAAEKEIQALRMLEEGPKPSAFDLEVEAYAEAIQNEAEATETEAATVAPVQVAEAVPATVEATRDEDEFDFLNDEEERKVKLKAFATRNRLRGVREELATETEAKRRADEEERSIMAYQLNEHYHVVDSGLMHAVIH